MFPLQLGAFRMVQEASIRPFQSADVGECHLGPERWNMALGVARCMIVVRTGGDGSLGPSKE